MMGNGFERGKGCMAGQKGVHGGAETRRAFGGVVVTKGAVTRATVTKGTVIKGHGCQGCAFRGVVQIGRKAGRYVNQGHGNQRAWVPSLCFRGRGADRPEVTVTKGTVTKGHECQGCAFGGAV